MSLSDRKLPRRAEPKRDNSMIFQRRQNFSNSSEGQSNGRVLAVMPGLYGSRSDMLPA